MNATLIATAAALASAICFYAGGRFLISRRLWLSLSLIIGGSLAAAVGATAGFLAISFRAYQHLSGETYLLDLSIEQRGPQRFTVRLIKHDEPAQTFELAGDEWLIEARILKWQPWATALGFPALVRVERLGGRYIDIDQEVSRGRTIYSLTHEEHANVWHWATRAPLWLPGLDTTYGTGTYLPLAHGARYSVLVTPSGLLARAANSNAEQAVRVWHHNDGARPVTF